MNTQHQDVTAQSIPAGYKQTEVGVIPEDWEVEAFGKIIRGIVDNRGKTPPLTIGGHPMVEVNAVFQQGKSPNLTRVTKFVSTETYENWFRDGHPLRGDILIVTVGSAGATSYVVDEGYCIAQNLISLRLSSSVNSEFIYYLTQSTSFKKQVYAVLMGAVQPSLKVPHLKGFLLRIPADNQEQTAIASALSDVDALIQELEKLIAKKRDIKAATMQQLLTGRTRLPQFAYRADGTKKGTKASELGVIPEDWEVFTIKRLTRNIIDYRGRTPKKLGMDWGGGNILALSAGNVKKGFINFKAESYYGSEKLYSRWMTTGEAQKNDIVFTMEAPLGNAALIPDNSKYILSQRTILLQIDRDQFLPNLIIQIFLSDFFHQYILDSATGSTAQGIKRSTFEKLYVLLPVLIEEQTAIATILSDMDTEIQTLEQRLSKTHQLKQGMMQELLTGRTRLVKPNPVN